MHASPRLPWLVLLLLVAAGVAVSGCGGEDGAGSRDGGSKKSARSGSKADGGGGDDVRNGLLLAAQAAGTAREKVAVWTGTKPPIATDPAAVDIDPPLGEQPRASLDGSTLAWLAPTRAGPQLWVRAGDASEDAKLVAITGDDGVLGVRSMDVSGDGKTLVVATVGARGKSDGLWLVDVASGGAREVVKGAAGGMQFAVVAANRDASLVAVAARAGGRASIGFVEVADSEPAELHVSGRGAQAGGSVGSLVFSTDDSLLFYAVSQAGEPPATAVRSIPVEELVGAGGGDVEAPVTYAEDLGEVRGLTVSPDGKLLAIAVLAGDSGGELRIVQLSNGADYARAIVPGVGTPVWVPADASDPAGFEAPPVSAG